VATASLAIFALSYAFYASNVLTTRSIDLSQLAFSDPLKGKKAVLLSDIHLSAEHTRRADALLADIAAIDPDIIFLVGDFVPWGATKADYSAVFDFLRHLDAPLGIFAVLGDADVQLGRASCTFCHSQDLRKPTRLNHVQFIRDNFVDIAVNGDTVRIAGLDSWEEKLPEMVKLPRLLSRSPTILLSHASLVYKGVPENRDVLVLAGDTHGGQVYLPGLVWKLWRRKPDPDHMYGLFNDGRKYLYVTSGIGTSGLPFRLGVPPEIAVFHF